MLILGEGKLVARKEPPSRVLTMEKTTVVMKKKVKIRSPILIEGLPGIGLVGKLAADHMAKELKIEKIAEVYSPHFPHQVVMQKNGAIRMLKNRIYHMPGKKHDVLILVGDVQAITPEAQYEVTGKLLDFFEKHGGHEIITLGGYGLGKSAVATPKVFGCASHKKLVESYKKYGIVFGESRGSIIGAAGLLLGLGKLRGMHGVCLMGETHGAYVDAKSAQAVLEVLSKMLGLKIDTKKLQERAKEGEKFLKKMEMEAAKQQQMLSPASKELTYIR